MINGFYTLTKDFSIDVLAMPNVSVEQKNRLNGQNTFVQLKKGQKINGTFIENIGLLYSPFPNIGSSPNINIPYEYFANYKQELNDNIALNKDADLKRKTDYEQSKIDFQKNAPLEDRFYQLFGLKYNPSSGNMFGFIGTSTFKGRFYLISFLGISSIVYYYKFYKK